MGKRKYEEAEPLLISGYEGMREHEGSIRERDKVLVEALQSLVQLFEATSRPDQATEWRTKLTVIQAPGPRARRLWPTLPPDLIGKPPPVPRPFSDDQASADR